MPRGSSALAAMMAISAWLNPCPSMAQGAAAGSTAAEAGTAVPAVQPDAVEAKQRAEAAEQKAAVAENKAAAADAKATLAGAKADDASEKAKTADEKAEKANATLAEMMSKAGIRFGFGIGPRVSPSDFDGLTSHVSVNPVDDRVTLVKPDRVDMVASVVAAYVPSALCIGDDKESEYCLGALINMNFAQFSWDPQTPGAFNNAIEGGIGVTFTLDRNFALGLTVERRNMRAVNPGVCDLLGETADYRHCEAIEIDADDDATTPETQLESLDVSDDNYFRDEPTTTLSLKFIFFVS